MKKMIFAALIALSTGAVFAEEVSTPEPTEAPKKEERVVDVVEAEVAAAIESTDAE